MRNKWNITICLSVWFIFSLQPFEIELNVFIQECDGEEGEVEDGAYGGEYEYVEGISEKIIEGIAEKKILKVLQVFEKYFKVLQVFF